MKLSDVTYTHELIFQDRLNEFLALGWRILEIKKDRDITGPDEAFSDRLSFLLGRVDTPKYPEDYDPLKPY